MKIPESLISELDRSIAKLEEIVNERDDDRATIYDQADLDASAGVADRDYDDWRQAQDDEREQILEEALDECKRLGVSVEHLKTLARETGALRWAITNSLKGA